MTKGQTLPSYIELNKIAGGWSVSIQLKRTRYIGGEFGNFLAAERKANELAAKYGVEVVVAK